VPISRAGDRVGRHNIHVTDGPSTDPYWWEAAEPRVLPETPVATNCDVAVVGAGYAGLSAALVLARAGRSVQIFDKQRPGEGASSRNGGIASGNIRLGFGEMIKTMGLDAAVRVYGEGKTAREGLAAFIDREKIDCDFQPVGRFTGAIHPSHYEAQGREADLLNKHLDIDSEMISKTEQHKEVGSDFYHGGMLRPDVAGLHPAKLHTGFLEKAIESGVTVHGETAVTGIRSDGGGFEVDTERGRVKARQVIVATNGYSDNSDRWLRRRLVPAPSRIIATEPLPPETMARLMPKRRMLGETRKLYHYYRPSPDGTRILFGGRSRSLGGKNAEFATSLRTDLGEIFPELADVRLSHTWYGFIAFNLDFLPRLFERNGIHYATGFCGSGVVWAWWIGSKLGFKLIGDEKAETAFSCEPPSAVPFYTGTPWFLPAALFWFGLQDRFGALSKK
jgi:glycine/D-amino acid oxidase-like deaminating enzyme